MQSYDLIVVGAGIIGAACAQAAAEAGLRVAVIERDVIGGDATAAGMGHLVALDDVPAEFALARYSIGLWQTWDGRPEAEFHRCGTLWIADDASNGTLLQEKAARLHAAGIEAELLDAKALRAAEPALAHDLTGGLLVPLEAVVYPPRIARTLLAQVAAHGGSLYVGYPVNALATDQVILQDGTRLNGPVLVACGCGTSALLPELAIRPRRGHLVITERYAGWLHHQVVEVGYAASAHGDAPESVACNVQPRLGGQLLIGSSRDYDSATSAVSPQLLTHMLQRCFRFFPGLPRLKALRTWTGYRPATPDDLPYIGALPSRRNVWVAAGHEGLGITTALGTAKLFLDLFLGHTPAIDPAPYSPARSAA